MKGALNSIIVAFSEILKWNTIKIALSSGAIVVLLWIGVGYYFWDTLLALGDRILEYIPFSMVKSNGAWMLSTFLWFQLVLITFALIYAFFGNLILQKVSKEQYSTYTFIILVLSALFWGVVWFFEGSYIYNEFLKLLTWLPFETTKKALGFIIGLYIIYNAIIVTLLFVASIFSEAIIKIVRKKHFNQDDVVKTNIFKSIKYTIKDTSVFVVLSIVLFPLLFVPVVNFFIQIGLWLWLTVDTISYDALFMVDDKVDTSLIKEHKGSIYFISFVTILFNFLPVVNIFGPFFGEIAMFHYFKSLKEES